MTDLSVFSLVRIKKIILWIFHCNSKGLFVARPDISMALHLTPSTGVLRPNSPFNVTNESGGASYATAFSRVFR